MNANNIYERLRTEIEQENTLSETEKILVKSILIQCFAEELKTETNQFAKDQLIFNDKLNFGIAQMELINKKENTN